MTIKVDTLAIARARGFDAVVGLLEKARKSENDSVDREDPIRKIPQKYYVMNSGKT